VPETAGGPHRKRPRPPHPGRRSGAPPLRSSPGRLRRRRRA
jgi:hypothetical protein